MPEIKSVEIVAGKSFQAAGKTYTPTETFAIGRFEKVEELEEELVQFSDKRTCHQVMQQAMAAINAYKPGEAYTLLYNKIETDQRNARLTHYVLRLCAAYINQEGEDVRYLSDELISAKIADWSEEGLDVRPFLAFAITVFNQLYEHYKRPIQVIFQKATEIKEAIEQAMDMRISTEASGAEKS